MKAILFNELLMKAFFKDFAFDLKTIFYFIQNSAMLV